MSSTRQDDERLLKWLELRTSGDADSAQIAKRFCTHQAYVRAATNRVKAADIKESGEPVEHVVEGYW